jgi:hypothetical protein
VETIVLGLPQTTTTKKRKTYAQAVPCADVGGKKKLKKKLVVSIDTAVLGDDGPQRCEALRVAFIPRMCAAERLTSLSILRRGREAFFLFFFSPSLVGAETFCLARKAKGKKKGGEKRSLGLTQLCVAVLVCVCVCVCVCV